MDEQLSFAKMLREVRRGDGEAARMLVSLFEPEIRRIIRVRLTDPRLRSQLDSVDICQSVLGDFFVRVGLGQFELETPEQLTKLLATMARNKLLNKINQQQAERRDIRRIVSMEVDKLPSPSSEGTPSQMVANRELLQMFRDRLTTSELFLVDQRAEGRTWRELGEELSETADSLRKRLQRAIDRIVEELGIET